MAAKLLPQHQKLLDDSAISTEVAEARGYFSATQRGDLEKLGFRSYQIRVPALVLPVHSVDGSVQLHQIRPDDPRKSRAGKVIKYETLAGRNMVIDVPPVTQAVIGNPRGDLWITEGIRKVDSLVSQGLAGIGLLGVWNWRGTNSMGGKVAVADFEHIALNGRRVYLCFDSDAWSNENVGKALARLAALLTSRGAKIRIVRLPDGPAGQKWGVDDYLASGHSLEDLEQLIGEMDAGVGPDRPSKATRLLGYVAQKIETFHTKESAAYVTFHVSGHRETWPVHSSRFKEWLRREFFLCEQAAIDSAALNDAIGVIQSRAIFEGEEREVYLRTATVNGCLYVDICDQEWRAVKIEPQRWRIVPSGDLPIHFRRTPGMLALPAPTRGGDLDHLRRLLRLDHENDLGVWQLVLAWLITAFFDDVSLVVLLLLGEQGTGKSFRAKILRSLLDPNGSPLRSLPGNQRDLVIAASNSWCQVFDNVSHIKPWLSDSLCCLSTGGGSSYRTLYSNGEETIFSVRRPVMLTSIVDVATRGDLLDRSIIVSLPLIPESEIKSEQELEREMREAAPAVMAGIFDALAGVLHEEPGVSIAEKARMADFAVRGTALERALGWETGAFMRSYRANRLDVNAVPIESSAVGPDLVEFTQAGGCEAWTCSAILEKLEDRASDGTKRLAEWPKTARKLSGELRRLAPSLRRMGFEVEFGRENKKRWVTLRPDPQHRHDRHTDTGGPANQATSDGCDEATGNGGDGRPKAGDGRSGAGTDAGSARNPNCSDCSDRSDGVAGNFADDEIEERF